MKTKRIVFEAAGMFLVILGSFVSAMALFLLPFCFGEEIYVHDVSISASQAALILLAALSIATVGILCSQRAARLKKLESPVSQQPTKKTESSI